MADRIILALVALAITQFAQASITASPVPNSDGNFTVSWDPHNSTDWYELKQQYDGGGWTTYTISATATSKVFVSRPPGTYKYRLDYCASLGHPDEWECFDTGYGTVTVPVQALPWPEPAEREQAFYEYETRTGDVNGDGRVDIYLDRTTSAESGNGALDVVLLTQNFDGTFATKVPSPAEANVASGWPITSIGVEAVDVDIDGFLDVVLTGIGSHIPGANDQIVYAPGTLLVEDAKSSKDVDADFLEFLTQINEWLTDESWFDDNAIWIEGQPGYWDWEWVCQFQWGGQGWDCGWEPVWIPPTPGYNSYDHFNQDAYELSELFGGSLVDMTIPEGSSTGGILEDLFGRVFNSDVFKGVLSGGGIAPWEISIPIPGLGDDRGFTFGVTIFEVSERVVEPGGCRPMTLAEEFFGAEEGLLLSLFVGEIKICNRKFAPFLTADMVTIAGNVYVNPNSNLWEQDYSVLPESPFASPVFRKVLFLHEMVHISQYHLEGCRITFGSCRFTKPLTMSAYDYTIVPNQTYFDYTSTEHRAEMVNDRWLLSLPSNTEGAVRIESLNGDVTLQQLVNLIPHPILP